jgi:NAD(P)-dependent dehydrogenase (short-subunit alcohol dehydrogenase family)
LDSRSFDGTSTADDVLAGIDLAGKLALVTGASSGLGAESARALAARGAAVVMTARDTEKAEAVAAKIREGTQNPNVSVMELHLEVPSSVRAFAKDFLTRHRALHFLIGNAGVMACPLERNADGHEMQIATNHFGHFLLGTLLAPALRAGAPARVVSVSSAGHRFATVDLDDPHFERRAYDKWASYGQSKTANIWYAIELDRRLAGEGVRAFAIHPGMIATELGRHLVPDDIAVLRARATERESTGKTSWKTVPQGAATQLYAATAPELDGKGALYLEDCQLSGATPCPGGLGTAPWAFDTDGAARLWMLSEKTTGGRL